MAEARVGKAITIAAPVIAFIIVALFAVSFLISILLALPSSLSLPIPIRAVGAAILLAGFAMMGWLFSYRRPLVVIVSTYVTLTKLFRRVPIAQRSGRTEPLVVDGPQRYVRHPLYFGIVVMVLGWALLTAYTFVFVATLVLFLWFRLFLIPFEEKELYALFGEQYRTYSDKTPTMIPFTKRRRRVVG
jgi:protein-S-isoprenylcysteine O-methyltransferase Ste14